MPAAARPSMNLGSAEKFVPEAWKRGLSGAGFSKLAAAMSAPSTRSRTTPLPPVLLVYGVSQPRGEQFLQRPVISAVPPSNGKFAALLLERQVDAAVEHDVAAGEQGPGGGRIVGVGGGRGRQLRGQRPVGEVLDAIDPEQGLAIPGQRPDLRPDGVGPQERKPLAVLGEVGGKGRLVGEGDDVRRVGVGKVERGEDGRSLALDQRERVEAGARPGQDRGNVLRGDRGQRRAEVRDGDDRHVRDLGWWGRRGGGDRRDGIGRRAVGRCRRRARGRSSRRSTGQRPGGCARCRGTTDEAKLRSGQHCHERHEHETGGDGQGTSSHAAECDRGGETGLRAGHRVESR